MIYESLLEEAHQNRLIVKEKPLRANKGRIKGNKIAISTYIKTSTEKACILAEELAHHYTSTGAILDQTVVENRKQEYQARLWAYNKMIGLNGLINAFERKCSNPYEIAAYLDVTEDFLLEAIAAYKAKYGERVELDDYIIYFEPFLGIIKL